MSTLKQHNDIGDNEIRIISQKVTAEKKRKQRTTGFIILGVSLVVMVICLIFALQPDNEQVDNEITDIALEASQHDSDSVSRTDIGVELQKTAARIIRIDTVADGAHLTILTPRDAVATLEVGPDALNDTTAVLVVQAADVRADNGEILGAYILHGKLLSRGQKKSGFCAIIDKKIHIGVADATPLFEQAIDTEGYFFRQYPLVVGGQIVENRPKGKALRKALAELNGEIVVILSENRLTFHDFSQALVSLGVSNAIYLVGASAAGFYRNDSGEINRFGLISQEIPDAVNYMVWK